MVSGWNVVISQENPENPDMVERIRNCRSSMALWKKESITNSEIQIRCLKQDIDRLSKRRHFRWEELSRLKRLLKQAYKNEEIYWRLQSRVSWLREGDKNSKYFHSIAKQRKSTNTIHYLLEEDSEVEHHDAEGMGNVATDYFTKLYTSEDISFTYQEEEALFGGQLPKVSDAQNSFLLAAITQAEVKDTVFAMGGDKSPGPDGLSGKFYQQFWQDVGPHLTLMVQAFMTSGSLDGRLNETSICLIPKKSHPHRLSEFRPISLCNFVYKVISKLLSSRLKKIMGTVISENQAAFVQGRLISDNILLAHEVSHSLRTVARVSSNFLALKTDMTKAFDRIEWSFLEKVLKSLGFADTWTERIMTCITTVTYGVIVNSKSWSSSSFSGVKARRSIVAFPFHFLCRNSC